ncbi:alpha beta-hydrolase [Fusarium subglutinans]|uniref:Alpha beta-hydrolase n=1 Tax=Gibberella subglutinans TaxID=42677 RepID=A0A8H5KQB7_GIBSU|nr:alpha beta-hydrolase [Fusarium subglutinans]KAF5578549.1 alpha beta-hydrolase [Fusarium subglutinans]
MYWVIFVHGGPDTTATNFAAKTVVDLFKSGVAEVIEEALLVINNRLCIQTTHDVISGIHLAARLFRYQTLIQQSMDKPETPVAPQAIIGVVGPYNLPLLRDIDPMPPICQQFLLATFGTNKTLWRDVSPARYSDFKTLWPAGKLAVMAYYEDKRREERKIGRDTKPEEWA